MGAGDHAARRCPRRRPDGVRRWRPPVAVPDAHRTRSEPVGRALGLLGGRHRRSVAATRGEPDRDGCAPGTTRRTAVPDRGWPDPAGTGLHWRVWPADRASSRRPARRDGLRRDGHRDRGADGSPGPGADTHVFAFRVMGSARRAAPDVAPPARHGVDGVEASRRATPMTGRRIASIAAIVGLVGVLGLVLLFGASPLGRGVRVGPSSSAGASPSGTSASPGPAESPAVPPSIATDAIVDVPASIDPTGKADVTADLQKVIDAARPGTEIRLGVDARYRVDGTL